MPKLKSSSPDDSSNHLIFLQSFFSGATQEIIYPLKSVLNLTNDLLKKYSERDFEYIGHKEFTDMLRTLKMMRDRLQHCFDTTQQLLNLNKKRVGFKEAGCDVNEVIHQTVGLMRHQLDISGSRVKLKLAKKNPPVRMDSVELTEVTLNILTNSIQSMIGGGTIYLRTFFSRKDKLVGIECRDEGMGIPKEILPHIFEPFFTTKQGSAEKNPGLGLSIVYSIIKAHKGDIIIKSSLRKGTLVTILLPEKSGR